MRKPAAYFLALALLFLAAASAGEAAPDESGPHDLSAAGLESFLDPLFKDQLEKYKIAGAVISVVKDGNIVFAKGYGYADIAGNRLMTADTTPVRPGSISKLFTGIAVMQLVEQGKLDLDRDVNDYLDFRIPTPKGGVPVTLRRLMTHRAGFEEHGKNLYSANPAPQPLGRFLAQSQPPRLFPNGDVTAYSNYGMALAGYIVERVSGWRFEDYVEHHILQPLAMAHSTFRQPLPESLAPLAAKSYLRADQPPFPFFETIVAAPAGALSATASDMGRFMGALLNDGALDDARVLSRDSLAAMMAPQLTTPSGNVGLVFVEIKRGGMTFIGHDGGTMGFFSLLLLSPQNRFGLFVSYDGYRGLTSAGAAGDLLKSFVHRYFPPVPPIPDAPGAQIAPWTEGVYQNSRRADSTLVRLRALGGQILIRGHAGGSLTLHSALWPYNKGLPLRRIVPHLYDNPLLGEISFEERQGLSARMHFGGVVEYEHVPWWIDARFVLPAVLASLAVCVLTLLVWPMAAIWRWRKGRLFHKSPAIRRGYLAGRLTAALQLAVAAGTSILFIAANRDFTILSDTLDPTLLILYALAWLSVAGSILAIWAAWKFWRQRVRGFWTRLHQTLLGASGVTLAWFFVVWRIAGTTLNY
jgi:CubicO group peptidase (beta-lactamase class C family)